MLRASKTIIDALKEDNVQQRNKVETSTSALDPWFNAEVLVPKCSYVINRTCQYPMLIM